jgi:tetratricopeptide (TPR) repeat protein
MNSIPFLTLLPILVLWTDAFQLVDSKAQQAIQSGKIKDAETLYKDFILQSQPSIEEVSLAKKGLALAYFKDQEHEKAFTIFLESLDYQPQNKDKVHEDSNSYQEALKVYLQDAGLNPKETAVIIETKYKAIYEVNRDDYSLGYLLAVGQANLNQYDRFFDLFYLAYQRDPEHFLAYKSKAALYIKLFERARSDQERECLRIKILSHVEKAIQLEPKDASLYRMLIGLTADSSKQAVLVQNLKKIVDNNIVISRIDIPYYAEMAIAFEEYDLAQDFLNKAREWYSYSRVITVAQQHLDEIRSQR